MNNKVVKREKRCFLVWMCATTIAYSNFENVLLTYDKAYWHNADTDT